MTASLGSFWKRTSYVINRAAYADPNDAADLAEHCRQWGLEFGKLGDMGLRGFTANCFTPYAHSLATHVPFVTYLHGGLEDHSGESLEKKNDEATKTYSMMTNCKDILGVLRKEKRREMALRNQAVLWHQLKLEAQMNVIEYAYPLIFH